jgi:hypothetical protein
MPVSFAEMMAAILVFHQLIKISSMTSDGTSPGTSACCKYISLTFGRNASLSEMLRSSNLVVDMLCDTVQKLRQLYADIDFYTVQALSVYFTIQKNVFTEVEDYYVGHFILLLNVIRTSMPLNYTVYIYIPTRDLDYILFSTKVKELGQPNDMATDE